MEKLFHHIFDDRTLCWPRRRDRPPPCLILILQNVQMWRVWCRCTMWPPSRMAISMWSMGQPRLQIQNILGNWRSPFLAVSAIHNFKFFNLFKKTVYIYYLLQFFCTALSFKLRYLAYFFYLCWLSEQQSWAVRHCWFHANAITLHLLGFRATGLLKNMLIFLQIQLATTGSWRQTTKTTVSSTAARQLKHILVYLLCMLGFEEISVEFYISHLS